MKLVTDSDIKQLLIEALDYNAHVIAMSAAYFGNVNTKAASKQFRDDFTRLSKDSEKRRKIIVGIED